MEYISFDDRKRARMVNWNWYYASIHPIFIAKELFTIKGPMVDMYKDSTVNCLDTIGNMVTDTKRELLSLKFCGFIDLQVCMFIFQRVGSKITRLFLEDINLMTDAFRTIITQCSNLKTLKLKNIDHWWCLSTESLKPTPSLEILVLKQQELPDNIFNFIMSLVPNIVTLDLDFCVYSTEVANTRFINCVNENSILEFLKTSMRLTHLKLNGNYPIFNRLPKNIQLKALNLNYEAVKDDELHEFLILIEEHKYLQKLEINYIPCCLLKGISKLSNLRELIVKFTTNHIFVNNNSTNRTECLNDFFASLKDMKDLRKLTIKPDVKIHQKYYKNLPLIPQQILQSLQSLDCYINIEKNNLPVENNLKKLRIRNGDALKAGDFKKISENLIHLKDLRIDQCYHLTDDILLQSKISNIKGNLISILEILIILLLLNHNYDFFFYRTGHLKA